MSKAIERFRMRNAVRKYAEESPKYAEASPSSRGATASISDSERSTLLNIQKALVLLRTARGKEEIDSIVYAIVELILQRLEKIAQK